MTNIEAMKLRYYALFIAINLFAAWCGWNLPEILK